MSSLLKDVLIDKAKYVSTEEIKALRGFILVYQNFILKSKLSNAVNKVNKLKRR